MLAILSRSEHHHGGKRRDDEEEEEGASKTGQLPTSPSLIG